MISSRGRRSLLKFKRKMLDFHLILSIIHGLDGKTEKKHRKRLRNLSKRLLLFVSSICRLYAMQRHARGATNILGEDQWKLKD